MQVAKRTLTAPEILALNATPIEIAPAPGAGKILVPMAMAAVLHFGGTAFAAGSQVNLYLGPLANGLFNHDLTAAFINAGADQAEESLGVGNLIGPTALANAANQNLRLEASGAAFTTGNGTLTVTVMYNTVSTS